MGGLDYCTKTSVRVASMACCACRGCELSLLARFPTRSIRHELAYRKEHPLDNDASAIDQLSQLPEEQALRILTAALEQVRELGFAVTTEQSSHVHHIKSARDVVLRRADG